MKNLYRKFNPLIYTVLMIFAFTTCKKDDSELNGIRTGNWSGTDISFTVVSSPLKITDLEFNYSGHAAGTICSFDYESSASFASVSGIDGSTFATDINTFSISGIFNNDTTAEIVIAWTMTDSNCDANYSGEKTYEASYIKNQ
jgi:hypothetical protein